MRRDVMETNPRLLGFYQLTLKPWIVRVYQNHPQIDDLLGLTKSRKTVMLVFMVYYSQRIQIKISKEKSPGEIRCVLPVESYRQH